jgi:hypothetical protein
MRLHAGTSGAARTWAVLLVFIAAAVGYFYVYPKMTQAKRFADVRDQAEELAAKCRARGTASDTIRFPQKILIWDPAAGKESAAQEHLPESLRAGTQDELGTLVLVLGLRKERTTEYMPLEGTTMGGPPEYRFVYTLGAVAWPKRQVAGTFEVVVDPPGMHGKTDDEKHEGNWFDRGLADWVSKRTGK